MANQRDAENRSRLIDQIEVEVIREPRAPGEEESVSATYEANPLRALKELVERMENLERDVGTQLQDDDSARTASSQAILDMQRHLEQFQRQSSILKRLLMKLH